MSPGFYKFLADALVVFHLTFVGFVLFGGLVVLRWRRAAWLHLPAVAWGIFIELSHGICPLTPLEKALRRWGRGATYQGGFVDHYVMRVLYPPGLTKHMQVGIAAVIVALNLAVYGWILAEALRARAARRRAADSGPPGDEAPEAALVAAPPQAAAPPVEAAVAEVR